MSRSLPIAWTKHVRDQKKKEELENIIRSSSTALSRLYDLLVEKELDLTNNETTVADFDSPSWAYKQAFRNGQRSSLKELKQLLEFIKG